MLQHVPGDLLGALARADDQRAPRGDALCLGEEQQPPAGMAHGDPAKARQQPIGGQKRRCGQGRTQQGGRGHKQKQHAGCGLEHGLDCLPPLEERGFGIEGERRKHASRGPQGDAEKDRPGGVDMHGRSCGRAAGAGHLRHGTCGQKGKRGHGQIGHAQPGDGALPRPYGHVSPRLGGSRSAGGTVRKKCIRSGSRPYIVATYTQYHEICNPDATFASPLPQRHTPPRKKSWPAAKKPAGTRPNPPHAPDAGPACAGRFHPTMVRFRSPPPPALRAVARNKPARCAAMP